MPSKQQTRYAPSDCQLKLNMISFLVLSNINTTGVTRGAGTANTSAAPQITPGF